MARLTDPTLDSIALLRAVLRDDADAEGIIAASLSVEPADDLVQVAVRLAHIGGRALQDARGEVGAHQALDRLAADSRQDSTGGETNDP